MISFRKYFGIIVMMAVLFVLFVFSVIVNEEGSFYDINEYAIGNRPSGADRWSVSEETELVIFIGSGTEELNNVVEQWCYYTKKEVLQIEQLEDYKEAVQVKKQPSMVLLDAEHINFAVGAEVLAEIAAAGIPVVFCNLPPESQIMSSALLREILGIEALVMPQTKISGVRLFDGFFLGGAIDYEAKEKEEKVRQDLQLLVPWYIMSAGTKTYMVGMKEAEEVRNVIGLSNNTVGVTGYFPSLIWRNSYEGTMVFAVCGDYMASAAGIGILNTFCYEAQEYALYPVVNAQSVLVHSFPNLSAENEGNILRIYSRNPQMYFRGIMWPSLTALAKINGLKLSCFINPQYDYEDVYEPKKEELPFYLNQLRELDSEAGMALSYSEYSSFEKMLRVDSEFYDSLDSEYCFQTVYTEERDLEAVKAKLRGENCLKQVVTVGTERATTSALFCYLTDDVTLQRVTGDSKEHSYMDDFTVRGIETALLYSNVLMDLHDAVWPKSEEDEWQNLYDELSSNIYTYWYDFRNYEQTTLSESDYRVRTMLNLDYNHKRQKNVVTLQVENTEGTAFFLLRTHDEKIIEIMGGEFQKLEQNAYLIKTEEDVVQITLEPLSLKEQKE